MASKDKAKLEWFGADTEENPDTKTTAAQLDGFHGVDSDIPRVKTNPDGTVTTELVRKPAPKFLHVKSTTPKDADIARLTARYKLMRSAFEFAPLDDKEMWETRRDLAFAEMQIARFKQKLDRYESQPNPRPEQVKLYRDTISMWRGRFAELTGQV